MHKQKSRTNKQNEHDSVYFLPPPVAVYGSIMGAVCLLVDFLLLSYFFFYMYECICVFVCGSLLMLDDREDLSTEYERFHKHT